MCTSRGKIRSGDRPHGPGAPRAGRAWYRTLRFVGRRLLGMVLVLLATVTITFFLVRLAPGGPFLEEKRYPPDAIAQLHRHYGLDDPLPVQYARYLRNCVRGDLGPSFKYPSRTVSGIIGETFPVSLELGAYGLLFAVAVGLTAGLLAAMYPNTWIDRLAMGFAMCGICVPSFVLGPLLVSGLALGLGWVNASGWETAADRLLPAVTLGAAYAAYLSRLSRGGMLEVMPSDYIRTARAKGMSETRVLTHHALRNGLLPVVSFLGPAAAGLITGSFVVETIFHIPGMGKMFVTAAFNRDYTLILGLVVFYAALVAAFNTGVDMVLAWMNPRLRLGG